MALTADQLSALQQGQAEGKVCVEIDASTPLRYCTGQNPIQVGSDWYYPRWLRGSHFDLTDPARARTEIEIDDRDKVIENAWLLDRFSSYDVTVHILLRSGTEKSYTTASSFTWKCESGGSKGGVVFVLKLYAAAGDRQRYGLMIGNASIFPWAPEPGEKFEFGGNVAYTPPSGGESPLVEAYGGIPSAYWSIIDPTGQIAFDAGITEKPYWVNEDVWNAHFE